MKRKSRDILEFEKEFYTICQKDVLPILSKYEPERKKNAQRPYTDSINKSNYNYCGYYFI